MLRSRLALFTAFWFVAISGALFYSAGGWQPQATIPGPQVVIARLLTDGPTLLAWLIAAFGIGGCLLRWLLPLTPSTGTPGEGWGEGDLERRTAPQGGELGGERDSKHHHRAKSKITLTPTLSSSSLSLRAEGQGTGRGSEDSLLRFISKIALGLGVISLLTLGLGLAGWLHHATALAIIVVGILLAILHLFRSGLTLAATLKWAREPARWNWLWICIAPFMAMALVASILPPGILWRIGDPSFYDVVEYHLQLPREWFELGRIVPLHHNVFSFFPLNVEMHYLLAMHLAGGPWEAMYLAQLMHLSFFALFVVAVYAVVRQIAAPLPAITAALAVATVPWITQLAPVAYDEGGFLLFSTLAIAWVWRAIALDQIRYRALALAGVFAGLACGVKLTAVPEVLVLLTFASFGLLLHKTRGSWPVAIRGALLFTAAGLITFAPWLIRNEIWAGNPVFPEAMHQLGPGEFNPAQVDRWERAHAARPDQRNLPARLRAAWNEIVASWQYGYVLFPLAIIGAVSGMTSGPRRPQTLLFAGMLLAITMFWMFATHLQGRFFVLAIPICGLLIAQIERPSVSAGAFLALCIGATISGFHLHRDLTSILRGGPDSPLPFPAVGLLGLPDLSYTQSDTLDGLAPGQPVILIGDAKAFFYTIPTSQLHYRTVFDVRRDNGDILSAWNDGPVPADARVIVDPRELERFHRTYINIPAVPDWIERQRQPFVLPYRAGH